MKKVSIFLLSLMALLPLGVKAETEIKEPVKVYMFEAGGCPYCEQEKAYLEGLDSFGVKFVLVPKESYVDHVNWAHAEDYELASKVAQAFKKAGFSQADVSGTPFVVISDLYAATGYSEGLETYIEQAYEEGDKDIVTCIDEGRDDCLPGSGVKKISGKALAIIAVSAVVLIGAILVLNQQFSKLEEVEEEKKEAPKKEAPKKEVEVKTSKGQTKKKVASTKTNSKKNSKTKK